MPGKTGGNYLLDPNLILEKAQIKEGEKVADLGCGAAGHFIFPAARTVGRKGNVYAVDILKTVLSNIDKTAKDEALDNISTVWSDVEVFKATDIETNSLDAVLVINTLYQSSQRAQFLKEATRMLKKNGRIVIVEWKPTSTSLGPPADNRVDKNSLKTGVQQMGLTLEEEFEAGEHHYGILFIK